MAAEKSRTETNVDAIALREAVSAADDRLLAACDVHTYRASGPGGQKRNKTSSAVRLLHRPSGVTAVGTESRSQHENKARALKRVREALAVGFRRTLAVDFVWPEGVQIHQGRLAVNPRNPAYFEVLGLSLDALTAAEGRAGEAAKLLGVSTSSLVRFLAENDRAWAEANRLRAAFGQGPLKKR